jgi:hypothetical protein
MANQRDNRMSGEGEESWSLAEAIVVHPSILIPGRKEDEQSSANEARAINGICSSRQSRLETLAVLEAHPNLQRTRF